MNDSVRRLETQVDLSSAGPRYRRAWLPRAPSRAMILVHGYAEHSGRYDEMAMHFATRGFAVHAYDQAGHGRTPGPRGHVDRYERLLDELAEFVGLVGREHAGLPLTLVGHSMGGLVVAATAAFRQPTVDRIVLSGALLQLGPGGAPRMRERLRGLALRALAPLGGRVGLSVGLDPAGLSRDPEVVRRYEADPLVRDRMSPRFAMGMLAMVAAVRTAADRVRVPVLVLHGGADPICPPAGSRSFHAGLAPEVAMASALRLYPDLRHEIFQEPERRTVWRDVLDWLDREARPVPDASRLRTAEAAASVVPSGEAASAGAPGVPSSQGRGAAPCAVPSDAPRTGWGGDRDTTRRRGVGTVDDGEPECPTS